jgi:hypothetical protein
MLDLYHRLLDVNSQENVLPVARWAIENNVDSTDTRCSRYERERIRLVLLAMYHMEAMLSIIRNI